MDGYSPNVYLAPMKTQTTMKTQTSMEKEQPFPPEAVAFALLFEQYDDLEETFLVFEELILNNEKNF
jgi:hypothetical protein